MSTSGSRSASEVTGQQMQRQVLTLILVSLVLLALFFVLTQSVDLLGELELPASVNPVFLGGAVICHLLFLAVAGAAWQRAIRVYSDVELPFFHSVGQISLVLIGKYIPGKVWGFIIRGKDLTRRGLSNRQMLMSNYAEQLVSVHAGLVFGGCGWLLAERPDHWLPLLSLLLVSALIAPLVNNRFAHYLVLLIRKVRKESQVEDYEIPFGAYLNLFCWYLLEWLFIGGILVCLYLMVFGVSGSGASLLLLPSMNALAFIVGFFAFFAPGGLGVRDGMLIALLSASLGASQAIYIAVLFRFWLTIFDALVGLLSIRMLLSGSRDTT